MSGLYPLLSIGDTSRRTSSRITAGSEMINNESRTSRASKSPCNLKAAASGSEASDSEKASKILAGRLAIAAARALQAA